jgi:hypothetical protein
MSGLNPVLRSEGSLGNRHLNILSAGPHQGTRLRCPPSGGSPTTRPARPGHRTHHRRCPQPTKRPQTHHLDPRRPRLRNPAHRPANPVHTPRHHDNPTGGRIDNNLSIEISQVSTPRLRVRAHTPRREACRTLRGWASALHAAKGRVFMVQQSPTQSSGGTAKGQGWTDIGFVDTV